MAKAFSFPKPSGFTPAGWWRRRACQLIEAHRDQVLWIFIFHAHSGWLSLDRAVIRPTDSLSQRIFLNDLCLDANSRRHFRLYKHKMTHNLYFGYLLSKQGWQRTPPTIFFLSLNLSDLFVFWTCRIRSCENTECWRKRPLHRAILMRSLFVCHKLNFSHSLCLSLSLHPPLSLPLLSCCC